MEMSGEPAPGRPAPAHRRVTACSVGVSFGGSLPRRHAWRTLPPQPSPLENVLLPSIVWWTVRKYSHEPTISQPMFLLGPVIMPSCCSVESGEVFFPMRYAQPPRGAMLLYTMDAL